MAPPPPTMAPLKGRPTEGRPTAVSGEEAVLVTLGEILASVPSELGWRVGAGATDGLGDRAVTAVEHDSRRIEPGSLFVALRGLKADGVAFAPDAAERGAVAIVAESEPPDGWTGPWIVVTNARAALAALAHVFFRQPSEHLLVVGVTGTNGKTTTTYLLSAVFERAGIACGRMGTVGYRIGREERPAARTTPEAPDMHHMLRQMVDHGCGACAMEVSSHALDLRRVDFVRFAAAVFTNLTRDHLDYHGDMEQYFLAKKRLFDMLPEGAPSIVNVDDLRGERLLASVGHAVTYGIDRPSDIHPQRFDLSLSGVDATVDTPRGSVKLHSHLPGRPNVSNVLAAVGTGIALDLPLSAIVDGIADVERVPGRFQVVSSSEDQVAVIVDYAHTDDALKNLLETARPLAKGRLITLFGCGGDRDRTKRPLMGAVAARLSDLVVLTSDNPRSEDPAGIIDEIKKGLVPPERPQRWKQRTLTPPPSTPYVAMVDREAAIAHAVREAKPGDLVVIAGKGHETTQEIGDRVLPFDDTVVARVALARRRQATSV
ncbi:MAG: UDP-N-acetylmuramoyl-L-alanyl-D-glutamate--2,6-diaminopimelate ligase [Luteitalea sp.]|nr:UDP-N-acetylmuramoyl-L-alanyl-D-glutamate--2,6-diaminopimelate ligase [Luteitalea sp.]